MDKSADICLILEDTYPYGTDGISAWVHDLVKAHKEVTFHIVCILSKGTKPVVRYDIPENVLHISNIFLHTMPKGARYLPKNQLYQLFTSLEAALTNLSSRNRLRDLDKLIRALRTPSKKPGSRILLHSEPAWEMLLRMYHASMPDGSFMDFFSSRRDIFSGIYTILLADLPKATCYHSFCTGYAGLLLARAKLETGKPCLLTEHSIYTHEHEMDIGSGNSQYAVFEKDLRDFRMKYFTGYAKLCYEACDQIISLYEGNRRLQVAGGADPDKTRVIADGINYAYYSHIERNTDHPPTIALIGRVVPIKDVKSLIRACIILRQTIPNLLVYIIGPTDEDEAYYKECTSMVAAYKLQKTIIFTGNANIAEYLPLIDVVVLPSISEAQPLVILEAGAAGIPTVTTEVGGCREIVLGYNWEQPKLGAGGGIASLANPRSLAYEIQQLLIDKVHYSQCSSAIKERVQKYYNEVSQNRAYAALYHSFIKMGMKGVVARGGN